jgi:small subunit ribosomal protein S1
VGDVVFGKIVEITDEALFVDLSGKARAIFDRHELTMPDEVGGSSAKAAEAPNPDLTPTLEVPVAPVMTEAAAAPEATKEASAEAESAEAPAAAESAAADAKPASAEAEAAPPPAPVHHEPHAPPVILEVGAHFVGIVHQDGSRGGLVVLTRHANRYVGARSKVAQAFKDKTPILGLVTGVIKGGVEVDVDGMRAFAPASHVELRLGADLHPLIGKRMPFLVSQYAKGGRDLVLSRRSMLETEAKAVREAAVSKLPIGTVVDGIVKSVKEFGAFIDVGGVEGLVPLTEMSHNRSESPHDVFKVGETVPVKILRVDEKGKVWLSRRATQTDPWAEVAKKYEVGSKHTGKVARLQPFGAFIELESGIDGLIHTADLSIKRIEHPNEVVKVGDPIDVVVATLDTGARKIGLHPAPSGEHAGETPQRVQPHKVVKVQVVSIDTGGLIVRILGATGRHARGFIPASATGTPRGTELRKPFPVGKELEAKIVEIDPKRGEVKLSIRAMNEETERNAYKAYQQQVKRESKFGTFGDLLAKKLGK